MHLSSLSGLLTVTCLFLANVNFGDANMNSGNSVSMKSQYGSSYKSNSHSREPQLDPSILSSGSKKKSYSSMSRSTSAGSMRGASTSMMMDSDSGSYRGSMRSSGNSRGSYKSSMRSMSQKLSSKAANELYTLIGEAVVKEGVAYIKNQLEEPEQPTYYYGYR
jgi:hypothetical protein